MKHAPHKDAKIENKDMKRNDKQTNIQTNNNKKLMLAQNTTSPDIQQGTIYIHKYICNKIKEPKKDIYIKI